ncbi:ECF-type sigma factor [Silanimonas sp.]|jgi:RNA polymerase sigma factor (TIGR02999 family)|uniref:ECF-type sigma factor n=1 Tax=Silanimonas sp. TaxID=1929290 RepID=UPI0022BD81AC|nr:ECF-type sigma factor [Silanimonas sp.]MCZ8114985.1 ECF-type sigma factor [Silanimonas sp.]
MSDDASAPITVLLGRWRDGDREAESQLIELLYPQLRRMAAAQSARQHGALTLAPTELANEAYLRFRDQQQVDWKNRDHLFAILATVLRRVLIDYLRERSAEKRGSGQVVVDIGGLGEHEHPSTPSHFEWLALEQALEKLQALDPEVARVVELRLFAGLGPGEIAAVTGSSVATVGRQWRFARSWLAAQLEVRDDESEG